MANIWDNAARIELTMARSLALLETSIGPAHPQRSLADIEAAIVAAWRIVVADVKAGVFSLDGAYLGRIHEKLATPLGAASPGLFKDEGPAGSWKVFIDEITREYPAEEAWIVAELFHGKHVESLGLSLAWLIANGTRLARGENALYPPLDRHKELIKHLGWAGAETWDAESLRATFGVYEAEQYAPPHGSV